MSNQLKLDLGKLALVVAIVSGVAATWVVFSPSINASDLGDVKRRLDKLEAVCERVIAIDERTRLIKDALDIHTKKDN